MNVLSGLYHPTRVRSASMGLETFGDPGDAIAPASA
jgi:hypothetical protein